MATHAATPEPADATFVIGLVQGMPGDTLEFEVFLATTVEIVAAQIDIILGPQIGIATDDLGQPRCSVNPDINKDGTTFALHCGGIGVCLLRARVFASDNVDRIPDGSALYTCEITVALDASAGVYPLTCASTTASDSDGQVMSTACVDGAVQVSGLPTPSPVPTATPPPASVTPAVTATQTSVATPPKTPGRPRPHNGGCQVAARGEPSGSWGLALLVAALWLRRRSARTGRD